MSVASVSEADRREDQGRGQLLDRVQEDERRAGQHPAANERHRDRAEDLGRAAPEPAGRLLDPGRDLEQRGADRADRERQVVDRQGEDQQRDRLVERPATARVREEDEGQRDEDPGSA